MSTRYSRKIEKRTRGMTKAQRRAYLLARGWQRIGNAHGSEAWQHPKNHLNEMILPAGDYNTLYELSRVDDTTFYSLAAATRRQLAEEDDE